MCSHVRELTLTQRTCPSDVVSQRIRSAVLSTIILITSAIKYHSTYYKCHFPFIFLGTATFNLTFFYRIFYFFCLLTSFVLSSDILFRDRFLFFSVFGLIVDLFRRLFFLGMPFANRRHPSCGARFAVRRFVVTVPTSGPRHLPRHMPRDMF